MIYDYSKDLSELVTINKYRLDEECVSHSTLYLNVASDCADARSELSMAKDKLTMTLADRYIEIKKYHAEKGDKVTEAMLSNEVDADEDVIEARKNVVNAEKALSKVMSVVTSMEQRKSELDNLVKLYCAGYFSTPVAGGERRSISDDISDSLRKRIKKGE